MYTSHTLNLANLSDDLHTDLFAFCSLLLLRRPFKKVHDGFGNDNTG